MRFGLSEIGFPVSARLAVAAIFFVNGALFGNWVARIPAVKEKLGLSEGLLGLALLAIAVGALVAMPVAGVLISRLGSRGITAAGVLGACVALPLVAVPGSFPALVAVLLALGVLLGSLDVAMNAQGAAVEKVYGRPIMNSFHAMFSIGGLAGAMMGGAMAALGAGLGTHFLAVAALFGALALFAVQYLLPSEPAGAGEPAFAVPDRAMFGLGIVAFCVLLGEGAVADWSAVYLSGTLGTGPGVAAAGFAAFSLMMTAGRLAGDRLNMLLGPVTLVRLGGGVAALGMSLALFGGSPAFALAGFAGVGAGFSVVFPIVLSTAARTPGVAPGAAIAAMSTMGYFGFLVGPPLIGFVAEMLTLRGALGLILISSAAIALLANSAARGKV